MTRRNAAAGALAGAALFAGGLVVANQDPGVPSFATATTTETVPLAAVGAPLPAPCTLVDRYGGTIADPCPSMTAAYLQGFRNSLGILPYYGKWKAANPNELATLRAYAVSPAGTAQPLVRTAFGGLVRWSSEQCRTWAPNVNECALP